MSDEERQRQMDFILAQQAQLTATVGQLAVTVDRLSAKVDRTADGIASLLTIAEIHEREIAELRGTAKDTDERLNALIDTVERYVTGRSGGS
jgi:chromosome segregation ATPase